MKSLLIGFVLFSSLCYGQEINIKGTQSGLFSLGTRTTFSTFNSHDDEGNGLGVGGQFRVQFADRVNTDWFFDYIRTDVGDYASRTDYHIGWSVLFYPLKNTTPVVRPYLLMGHCFDNSVLVDNRDPSNSARRLSSAVQGGAGFHWNLSPRLDLSFVAQYMLHLGKELHAENHFGFVHFHEESRRSLEGHLLVHVGINYKIADLW